MNCSILEEVVKIMVTFGAFLEKNRSFVDLNFQLLADFVPDIKKFVHSCVLFLGRYMFIRIISFDYKRTIFKLLLLSN